MTSGTSRTSLQAIGWLGLGLAAMYWLDPDMGPRRRAVAVDRASSAARRLRRASGARIHGLAKRAREVAAEGRALVRLEERDDRTIAALVRERLGSLTSHPGAIEIDCLGGRVRLSGHVLARELDEVLAGVLRVRGVREVSNRLTTHETPGSVPALQGEPSARSTS